MQKQEWEQYTQAHANTQYGPMALERMVIRENSTRSIMIVKEDPECDARRVGIVDFMEAVGRLPENIASTGLVAKQESILLLKEHFSR